MFTKNLVQNWKSPFNTYVESLRSVCLHDGPIFLIYFTGAHCYSFVRLNR